MRSIPNKHDEWAIKGKATTPPQFDRLDKFAGVMDPRMTEILAKIGRGSRNEATARRVMRLEEKAEYANATLPELLAIDYLERNNIPFLFQVIAAGGRNIPGGRVPDFVLPMGSGALVILVQGEWYHPSPQVELQTRLIIMSSILAGMKPWAVVQVFEDDIYLDQEGVMSLAVNGIETERSN
jgi:hypothetical protein